MPKHDNLEKTIEDLQSTIKDLQSTLDKAQEELKNLDSYEKFVPKEDEEYYYLNSQGNLDWDNNDTYFDKQRIAFYNCFKTKEEVQLEREKILVRRMLEDIANRLNGSEKVDWSNDCQRKFSIFYGSIGNSLGQSLDYMIKRQGTVYCLSNDFLNVAKEEIGTERLIRYIKEQ